MLGLRFDRVVTGFVDSYTGDPELRRRVANEPRPEPSELATGARRLRDGLDDTELSGRRRRFLAGQLTALECSARELAGERIPYPEVIRRYFQTEIAPGDPGVYREAHAELDEALPGSGPLADRLAAVRDRDRIPPEALQRSVAAISAALRGRVRSTFGLPPQESVDYRLVNAQPWSGLHSYLGDYRSRVLINADAGHRMTNLPHLIAHEAYPGHHTQHCCRDTDEHAIFLVNTPQCLVSEGLAELGLATLIGSGWAAFSAGIFAELGMRMEADLADRVHRITGRLRAVRQDAALMAHHGGRDSSEIVDHLQRWLLVPRARAERMLTFVRHPLWRAYTTTYVEGHRLVSAWLSGGDAVGRYQRLLDEPLSPVDLDGDVSGRIRP